MNQPRRLVLCADDYAIHEGATRGMLELIDGGRLTAVSAMASSPLWREAARDLARRRGGVAIGLHFDLTQSPFEGREPPYPLPGLIRAAVTGRLDAAKIGAEFERQLDAFEQALGFRPDHVDSHHHVHALPALRTLVIAALLRRYGALPAAQRPRLRDPADAPWRILGRPNAAKALTVAALSSGFGRQARRVGLAANQGFSGFSAFEPEPIGREFAGAMQRLGPRPLVMCHPALSAPDTDPIGAARIAEQRFLAFDPALAAEIAMIRRDPTAVESAFAELWPD